MKDSEIIKLILQGDKEKLRMLVVQYQQMVFRTCMGFMYNNDGVWDSFETRRGYNGNGRRMTNLSGTAKQEKFDARTGPRECIWYGTRYGTGTRQGNQSRWNQLC